MPVPLGYLLTFPLKKLIKLNLWVHFIAINIWDFFKINLWFFIQQISSQRNGIIGVLLNEVYVIGKQTSFDNVLLAFF